LDFVALAWLSQKVQTVARGLVDAPLKESREKSGAWLAGERSLVCAEIARGGSLRSVLGATSKLQIIYSAIGNSYGQQQRNRAGECG